MQDRDGTKMGRQRKEDRHKEPRKHEIESQRGAIKSKGWKKESMGQETR